MEYNVEVITPVKAAIMLKSNPNNRNLTHSHVAFLAMQMMKGDWTENGQSIVMDFHNNIVDGQHRLNAIVQSGKSIPMLVVRGVNPQTMNTIDTGRSRNASDVFTLNGVKNANTISSVTRMVMVWEAEKAHNLAGGARWKDGAQPSNDDIYNRYLKDADDFQWVFSKARSKSIAGCLESQAGCALAVLLKKHSKSVVAEFVDKIKNGGDYAKSPTHFLSGWVRSRREGDIKVARNEQIFAIIWAFEKWLDSKEMKALRIGVVMGIHKDIYARYK
jgi:acylphosphatase